MTETKQYEALVDNFIRMAGITKDQAWQCASIVLQSLASTSTQAASYPVEPISRYGSPDMQALILDKLASAVAPTAQPTAEVKTGWPPGMLQDDSKQLSRWLSNTPNARQDARDATTPPPVAKAEPTAQPVQTNLNWTALAKWWESGAEDFAELKDVIKGMIPNTPPPVAGDVAQLMAKEYAAWIDFYHRADGDYDDFLKKVFAANNKGNV